MLKVSEGRRGIVRESASTCIQHGLSGVTER